MKRVKRKRTTREVAQIIAKEYQEQMGYDDRLCRLEEIIRQRLPAVIREAVSQARKRIAQFEAGDKK